MWTKQFSCWGAQWTRLVRCVLNKTSLWVLFSILFSSKSCVWCLECILQVFCKCDLFLFLKGLIFASTICFCSSNVFEPKLCCTLILFTISSLSSYAFNVFQYNERTHPHPPGTAPQQTPPNWVAGNTSFAAATVCNPLSHAAIARYPKIQNRPSIRKSKISDRKNPISKKVFFLLHFWGPLKNRFFAKIILKTWKKFKTWKKY